MTVLQAYLRWWRDELISILPRRWRELSSGRLNQLRIAVSATEVIAYHESGGRTRELGRQPRTDSDEPGHAPDGVAVQARRRLLTAPIQALKSRPARVILTLAPGLSLTKELAIPLAAQRDLAQVLTFEMDRQTPFRAESVYFDYRVIGRDPSRKQLTVRLGVVPRALVDTTLSLLSDLQLRMSQPGSATDSRWDGRTFLLVPAADRQPLSAHITPLLVGLNGLLLLVAVSLPFYHQRSAITHLDRQLEKVRQAAHGAMSLREQAERLAQEIQVAVDRKSRWPTMVEILNELTAILPDSTWLSRLEIKGGEIHLQGVSGSASSLIALIEESKTFADVRFQSPVTQDTRTGRERFHLSARISGQTPDDI